MLEGLHLVHRQGFPILVEDKAHVIQLLSVDHTVQSYHLNVYSRIREEKEKGTREPKISIDPKLCFKRPEELDPCLLVICK